eukprot:COSAG01_NODE_1939_length_8846_cov_15.705385_11_plen_69_part_00
MKRPLAVWKETQSQLCMTRKAGASMAMSTTGLQRPYKTVSKTVSTTMKRLFIGLQIPVVQIATSSQLR